MRKLVQLPKLSTSNCCVNCCFEWEMEAAIKYFVLPSNQYETLGYQIFKIICLFNTGDFWITLEAESIAMRWQACRRVLSCYDLGHFLWRITWVDYLPSVRYGHRDAFTNIYGEIFGYLSKIREIFICNWHHHSFVFFDWFFSTTNCLDCLTV